MTATVPALLAWPLLVVMALVVGLRYLFFNHSQWERYLNHALAFMLAADLIRERVVEDVLAGAHLVSSIAIQHFSLVLMIFAAAEFAGFITVWSRLSPHDVRRRQRYHRLAALLLSAAFLVAATPSRVAGQTLEVHGGWSTVLAWAFHGAVPLLVAVQLLALCVRELRETNPTRNERLVVASGLAIGLTIGVTSVEAPVLGALEQLGLLYSRDYRIELHGFIFMIESTSGMFLAALPLALAVSARAGHDVISRRWRWLQPLRKGMIAAVPSVAYDLAVPSVERRKTTLDLHQTSVQIRDAILQLRPYFRDVAPSVGERFVVEHSVPLRRRQDAVDALQLAFAVHAKAAGLSPNPIDYGAVFRSRSATLDEETSELLRLARWWPAAAAAADRGQLDDTEVSASNTSSAKTA